MVPKDGNAELARGEVVRLEGGGHVAYDEYGDPNGTPVLFYHGWPSSRSMAQLADESARRLGVRIIAPDRPGICGSSFVAERTLLDWPEVLRSLIAHFGFDKVRIVGISGGAPYAYISAWAMPEQVSAIAVVSGAPPIAELPDRSGLWRMHRWMLGLHAHNPALMRKFFRVLRPFACLKMSIRHRPFLRLALQRLDADALRDARAFDAFFNSSRKAWRSSLEGVLVDAEIYARPWGFRLEDVPVPVRMWHGTKDRTFSYHLAEGLAQRLPSCQLRIVEDAGHYSLPIRHVEEILRDLVSQEGGC